MGKDPNIPFLELIHEVFDPVFAKYGFVLQEEVLWIQPEKTVYAAKDDIRLTFRLGSTQLFWYFSLGVKPLRHPDVYTTSDTDFRELGVAAIAGCLNPSYKRDLKASQTEAELRKQMESKKQDLLKYCDNLFSGNFSDWQKVIACLDEKKKSRSCSIRKGVSKSKTVPISRVCIYFDLVIFNGGSLLPSPLLVTSTHMD